MKRTLFSSAIVLALAVLLSWAFSFYPAEVNSKPATEGTITVCWAEYCASAPELTVVNLVNADGKTVGTCTITPPRNCCRITGDFPTGSYYLTYYHPTGPAICRTGVFYYTNGTDITMSVICHCP